MIVEWPEMTHATVLSSFAQRKTLKGVKVYEKSRFVDSLGVTCPPYSFVLLTLDHSGW